MQYRAEIDGLRAIAVIPVILFHAGFEWFGGGFVGVDVFFVISGYLITAILIEDITNNRFSIPNFYERRARRILPALFFVMLCCMAFAWMWMLPSQMKDFSQSLVATSLFAANILFWRERGYFAATAEEKPLLHTWSLAIEEQYYFLFPIFLIMAWRFGRDRVFWLIVVFAFISLVLSEWGWRNKATANFYLAPTRAWELFAGSIAAFIVHKRGVQANNLLSLFGLSAIIFAIFVYDKSTPFPSLYTLVPVVGVVLLVMYADKGTLAVKFLGMKVLVGIGLISYSAYLWHQPLFAFARIRLINVPSELLMLSLTAISLVLGFLSWKFVEQPLRKRNGIIHKQWQVFMLSLIGLFVFVSVGLGGHFSDGYPERVDQSVTKFLEFRKDTNPYRKSCHLSGDQPVWQHPLDGCKGFYVDNQVSVIFVGDSHSNAISYSVQRLLKDEGIGSYALGYGGCIGLAGFYRVDVDNSHRCDEYNQSMINFARSAGVKTVVITSRFPAYLEGSSFNNGEGGVEHWSGYIDTVDQKPKKAGWDSAERRERVKQQYFSAVNHLLDEFNVVLVDPIPEAGWSVPALYAQASMFAETIDPSTSLTMYRLRNRNVFEVFEKINHPGFIRVSVADSLCSEETQRCRLGDSEGLYYYDDDHLSVYGANVIAPDIVNAIKQTLSPSRSATPRL